MGKECSILDYMGFLKKGTWSNEKQKGKICVGIFPIRPLVWDKRKEKKNIIRNPWIWEMGHGKNGIRK